MRIIFIILCIVYFSACDMPDNSSGLQPTVNKNILRYDVNTPFTSLNPLDVDASGSGANFIFPLLFSYLFVPNEKGDLEPDLAVSWAYDSEKFIWTIQLRENAFFHNKQPVTSRDVEQSIKIVLGRFRPSVSCLLNSITLLGDNSLVIQLNKNDPMFLKKIWDTEIIPHSNDQKIDFSSQPIGSGAFKFKYRKGNNEVMLVSNDDYYNGRPDLDGVNYYYQPDKERSWTRLLAGQTDIANEISPKNFEIIKKYEHIFYFDHYIMRYYSILLYNISDPLFSDPNVRLALSHGINREYIIKNILKGYGVLAVSPMGVNSPFHNPELKPVPYNPEKALELLNQAGWRYKENSQFLYNREKYFEFELLIFKESQVEKKVARFIKLCLNDIGIKVRLKPVPYDELIRRYHRNNEFQAVITELSSTYRYPEYLAEIWSPYSSDKSRAGCFGHPKITALLKLAVSEKDKKKHKALMYKAEALITSLQPGTFLYHKTAIDVMSRRFKLSGAFSLTSEGIHRLKHVTLACQE